ncbi:hypothetical protein VSDG_02768 [Cytospora chrysosperma]|uniref:SGNH hydrolase-type esterase domain-containing protein n=1 Tax=Cytospora chrysosperma TaxID=252740 RepID=A0A423WC17_CYTCH|nr:hypothetical protein VSDG_02768 [Valsa sordida]
MSYQDATKPFEGRPLSSISIDSTPISTPSSQRSSYNSDQKLLLQSGTPGFSRLSPRTWSRKAKIIALAAFTLAIVALIPAPAVAVPLSLDPHHISIQSSNSSSSNVNSNGNTNSNGNNNDNTNSNVNSNGNTNSNGNNNDNTNSNGNGNDNTNSNGNSNGNTNSSGNSNDNTNSNGNSNGNTNSNGNGNSNGNSNGNTNSNGNSNDNNNDNGNNNQTSQGDTQQPPATSSTTPLRIMPLGASITWGLLSTDGNGYRNDLLELLQQGGNRDVTYVGSRNNGTMADNAVEGWPGDRIDQLLPKARASVPRYLPNVVLVNAGTNDCVQDFDLDATTRPSPTEPGLTGDPAYTVGTRMRALVDGLLGWSPNATVVLSTLINNVDAVTQTRIDDANEQFRAVAREMQSEGKRVVLAEMTAAAGGPDLSMMADVTHPNDAGYALMAKRWYAALVEASQKGFIVPPA